MVEHTDEELRLEVACSLARMKVDHFPETRLPAELEQILDDMLFHAFFEGACWAERKSGLYAAGTVGKIITKGGKGWDARLG